MDVARSGLVGSPSGPRFNLGVCARQPLIWITARVANNPLLGVLTADDVTEFLAEELTEVARIVPHQIKREHATRDPVDK